MNSATLSKYDRQCLTMTYQKYRDKFKKEPVDNVYSRTGKKLYVARKNPFTAVVVYPSGVVARKTHDFLRVFIKPEAMA